MALPINIDEQEGVPVLPPAGIDLHVIDGIQKELVNLCALVQPTLNVLSEPVEYMGGMILVIYVPGGEARPYKAPKRLGKEAMKAGKVYYVRKGSVTKMADQEEERMLIGLCNKVPFDDRIHQTANKARSLTASACFRQINSIASGSPHKADRSLIFSSNLSIY